MEQPRITYMGRTTEQRRAYKFLRLLTGIDFFGHGFARVFGGPHLSAPHLADFAQSMVKNMAGTPLPPSLALATGYAVPCVELLIGILLLLGITTRLALTLALLLMFVLMFGITLKQDWNTAATQLLYGFILATLLFGRESYDLSWPSFFRSILKH